MKLRMINAAVFLPVLVLISTGCGTFKSEPAAKRKSAGLSASQTGTNIRRPASPTPADRERAKRDKAKQTEEARKVKAESAKPAGRVDEDFTTRGGFR